MALKNPRAGTAYPGVRAGNPPDAYSVNRAPTTSDYKNFFVMDLWRDTSVTPPDMWILVARERNPATGNVEGTWVKFVGGGGDLIFLTGDVGGAVGPDAASNINLLGGAGITTTGVPATNTITFATAGDVARSYDTDAGTAVPALGVLQVLGGTNVNTAGAGNAVTINADGALANEYVTDAGTAVPVAGTLNVLGGTAVNTAGAGDTVTINADADVATRYDADSGSATPAANVLNVVGAGGITTSGAGDTLTIDGTGATGGVIITTFTSSGMWTKNANAQWVIVYGWNGGSGGGGGGALNNANDAGGSGAGFNGSFYHSSPASLWGASETVTVGGGGTGGTGETSGVPATDGTAGGQSSIGNVNAPVEPDSFGKLRVPAGGTTPGGDSGKIWSMAWGSSPSGSQGGDSKPTIVGDDAVDIGGDLNKFMMAGSGGGGGSRSSGVARDGGKGSDVLSADEVTTILAGGTAGVAPGGNGGNGVNGVNTGGVITGGSGGGGGAGHDTSGQTAGFGGNGGVPGGSGGGGGTATSVGSGIGGDGGDGARGEVVVVEFI